jgi:hypothetical protein
MGMVVAALHRELDGLVALKFLLPAYLDSPQSCERFAREARTGMRIKNEHVARVFDVGTVEGAPFMVMEYLTGRDLSSPGRASVAPWPLSSAGRCDGRDPLPASLPGSPSSAASSSFGHEWPTCARPLRRSARSTPIRTTPATSAGMRAAVRPTWPVTTPAHAATTSTARRPARRPPANWSVRRHTARGTRSPDAICHVPKRTARARAAPPSTTARASTAKRRAARPSLSAAPPTLRATRSAPASRRAGPETMGAPEGVPTRPRAQHVRSSTGWCRARLPLVRPRARMVTQRVHDPRAVCGKLRVAP